MEPGSTTASTMDGDDVDDDNNDGEEEEEEAGLDSDVDDVDDVADACSRPALLGAEEGAIFAHGGRRASCHSCGSSLRHEAESKLAAGWVEKGLR